MIEVKYINSQGLEFNFTTNPHIKIKDADFHKYAYGSTTTPLKYGVKVSGFTRDAIALQLKLYIDGTRSEINEIIDSIHDAGAYDRAVNQTGRVYYGSWYIDAYLVEGDTYPNEKGLNVTKDLEFLCPYPMWIKEETLQFYPQEQTQSVTGLDFPTDFPFDFAQSETGAEVKHIDNNVPNDAIIRIYGACENPKVTINNYPYQVFTVLEAGDYLEIDTRNHTVTKFMANGTTANLYNSRAFDYSVFEKIPSGDIMVNWLGSFGFDVVVFIERSVPKNDE